ncbi:hypothetical protein SDRG_09505 [Saprolegnia diclina VS20]|uniref:Uncharacterized protein n=1 Tax=Saprolegnia diclina (strain VS20) TaxID=1156394 RepID=T0QE39_SAPDV|nr:hypothetical protein SDRG_09505 [Saprolegnia diclina VS20]EQC32981.1 hypothetical protein SDRG_09505 [Saprolegnia diclina VS20]|eukprot:XP_008613667.1 hypothetical protein SDRG_09505 [Saprolegnia diclina VS20]
MSGLISRFALAMPDWDPLYLQKRDLKLLVMREAAALAACSGNSTVAKSHSLCRVPADTPKPVVCHITAVAPMTAPRTTGRRLSEPTSWLQTAPLYKFGVTSSAATPRPPTAPEPLQLLSDVIDTRGARTGGAKPPQASGDFSDDQRSPEPCVHWTTSVILHASPALWKVLARASSTPTSLAARRDPSTRRHSAPERQFETTFRPPPVACPGSRRAADQRPALHSTNEQPRAGMGGSTKAGPKQSPLISKGGTRLQDLTARPVASTTEMSTKVAHVAEDAIPSCCAQRTEALVTELQAARDECKAAKATLHRAVGEQAATVAASWRAQRDLRDEIQRHLVATRYREAKAASEHAHELQVLQRELNQVAGELEGALANHAASVFAYTELFASTVAGHEVTIAFLEAQMKAAANATP